MRTRLSLVLAAVILGVLVLGLGSTWLEGTRKALMSAELRLHGPGLACPTGYDEHGACVGWNLAGGVHAFFFPGLLAAGTVCVVGAILGLGAGYGPASLRGLFRASLSLLESLPRLVMLLLVVVLFDHSLLMLGLALGILSSPALAHAMVLRIQQLERSEFIHAARAHGLSELYLLGKYVLNLSCRGDFVRHAFGAFTQVMLVQVSLSVATKSNLSATEWSWGRLLQRSTERLYAAMIDTFSCLGSPGGPSEGGLLRAVSCSATQAWHNGLFQFCCVCLAILGVSWAVTTVGENLAVRLERDR